MEGRSSGTRGRKGGLPLPRELDDRMATAAGLVEYFSELTGLTLSLADITPPFPAVHAGHEVVEVRDSYFEAFRPGDKEVPQEEALKWHFRRYFAQERTSGPGEEPEASPALRTSASSIEEALERLAAARGEPAPRRYTVGDLGDYCQAIRSAIRSISEVVATSEPLHGRHARTRDHSGNRGILTAVKRETVDSLGPGDLAGRWEMQQQLEEAVQGLRRHLPVLVPMLAACERLVASTRDLAGKGGKAPSLAVQRRRDLVLRLMTVRKGAFARPLPLSRLFPGQTKDTTIIPCTAGPHLQRHLKLGLPAADGSFCLTSFEDYLLWYLLGLRSGRTSNPAFLSLDEIAYLLVATGIEKPRPDELFPYAVDRVTDNVVRVDWAAAKWVPGSED